MAYVHATWVLNRSTRAALMSGTSSIPCVLNRYAWRWALRSSAPTLGQCMSYMLAACSYLAGKSRSVRALNVPSVLLSVTRRYEDSFLTFHWFTNFGIHVLPVFALLHRHLPNCLRGCFRCGQRWKLWRHLAENHSRHCQGRRRDGVQTVATLYLWLAVSDAFSRNERPTSSATTSLPPASEDSICVM